MRKVPVAPLGGSVEVMDRQAAPGHIRRLRAVRRRHNRDNLTFIQIPPMRPELRFAQPGHLRTRMLPSRKKGDAGSREMSFGPRSVMLTPSENADSAATTMFRNLSTSTKLIVLCGAFIIAIAVAIYTLVAEQQIAIEFAKKELIGAHYVEAIRGVYSRLLGEPGDTGASGRALPTAAELLNSLNKAEAAAKLNTGSLEQSLANTLRRLWSDRPEEGAKSVLLGEAPGNARDLISRVGDDSNLAVDHNLDSYYLQHTLLRHMPRLLGQIGDIRGLTDASSMQ